MYDYKARIYSPRLGRFLQTDAIGYEGGINIYEYVGDDPMDHSDPTGLLSWQDASNAINGALETAAGTLLVIGGDAAAGGGEFFSGGLATPLALPVAAGATSVGVGLIGDGARRIGNGLRGSDGSVLESRSSRRGQDFTRATKTQVRREQPNCEKCGRETTSGKPDTKGNSPREDRSEIHHKDPASEGGTRDRSNAQNLCRKCHLEEHNEQ
jgi:hypothetical protein